MDNRELELVQMGTKDQQIHTVIKLDLNFELKVNQIMSQYLTPAISKCRFLETAVLSEAILTEGWIWM